MSNRSRNLTLIVVVAAVIIAGLWWRGHSKSEAPKFRVADVERGAIETLVSATGTLEPVVQVEVGSQVSGTVLKLDADYNDRVRAEQVLCQLDPSSFRARAVQAEAAVARSEAALKEAKRLYARAQELVQGNYVSKEEAEAKEVQVEQAEADLKQSRAQYEVAKVDLDHTTIRSPIDGVVIARSVDLGQTVAASLQAPKLFVIANDLQHMQVETRIDEADIGQIRIGMPVRFTVDAFQEQNFQGRIQQVRLEPIVEQGVVTYTTVIQTDNPDLRLRPGMTANVSVLVDRRDDVLKVPNAALRFRLPNAGKRPGSGGGARVAGAAGDPGAGAGPGAALGAVRSDSAHGARPETWRGGPAGARGGGPNAWPGAGRGGNGGAWQRGRMSRDDPAAGAGAGSMQAAPAFKPGQVFVLRDGKPVRVVVMTGISDGAATEVRADSLKPGDMVVVGFEVASRGQNLQPPPGMGGGPGFGGGRPGGGGAGGGRR